MKKLPSMRSLDQASARVERQSKTKKAPRPASRISARTWVMKRSKPMATSISRTSPWSASRSKGG